MEGIGVGEVSFETEILPEFAIHYCLCEFFKCILRQDVCEQIVFCVSIELVSDC